MSENEPQDPQQVDIKILSDDYPAIMQDIEALCIHDNISGRNQFRIKYPSIAAHIYGPELIAFDDDGIGLDEEKIKYRSALENEAYERQQALHETLSDLADKTIQAGMVQKDFLNEIIQTLGVDILRPLFDEELGNKLFGAVQKSEKEAETSEPAPQETTPQTPPAAPDPSPVAEAKPEQAPPSSAPEHQPTTQTAQPAPEEPAMPETITQPETPSEPVILEHESQPVKTESLDAVTQPVPSEQPISETQPQPAEEPKAVQPQPEPETQEEKPKPSGEVSDLQALFGGDQE